MEPNTNASFQAPNQNQIQAPVFEGPIKLFSSAWQFFKANWKILVQIIVYPIALIFVSQLLVLTGNLFLIIISLMVSVVGLIVNIIAQPASINAIFRLSNEPGVKIKIFEQYKLGFKYLWSIIWFYVLSICLFFGSFSIFLIPGIIIAIYSSLYFFILVLEDKKGLSAFEESYSLVKGRWWGVLGRILFVMIIAMIIAGLLTFLSSLTQSILGITSESTGGIVVSIIFNLIINSIVSPFVLVYLYKMYFSLKETRQINVSTSVYRKWIIAFSIIGIIVMIVGLIVTIALPVIFLGGRDINKSFQAQSQLTDCGLNEDCIQNVKSVDGVVNNVNNTSTSSIK